MTEKPDAKKIMERALDTARDIVLSGKQADRIFLAANTKGEVNVVVAPKGDQEDEPMLANYLKLIFAVWGVTQYAMVTEAWMVELGKNEKPGDMPPSEHPNREEVLIGTAVRRIMGESGEPLEVHSIAKRRISRNPTAVGDIEWMPCDRMDGRMLALLPPKDLPPCPPDVEKQILNLLSTRGGPLQHFSGGSLH